MTSQVKDDADKVTKRAELKDRLAIGLVVVVLVSLLVMMFLDSVMNFQCSAWQFITLECNRFDAGFKPWK